MPLTSLDVNAYNFTEKTQSDRQVKITNALGRALLFGELVYQDGYFGDVTDQDGIAIAGTGTISIDHERKISTEQMEATDTFVAGATLWFVSGGSSAAGTLVDADPGSGTRVAVGIITGEQGTAGAQTSVEFRPYVQLQGTVAAIATNTTAIGTLASLTTTEKTNLVGAVNEVDAEVITLKSEMLIEQAEPKILVQKITTDASTGIAVTGLVEGDEIIGMSVICTAANASGTFVLETGTAGDDITDGVICAVDKVVTYAGTIDDANSTLPATGAQILSVGGTAAATRGIVIISYIPA